MLTKDDLKAIAETLRPLIKVEINAIRKDMATKSDLEASNRIMGQIFKIELAATRKEMIDAMRAGFHEVAELMGEFKENHEERMKQLEEHVSRIEKQQSFRA